MFRCAPSLDRFLTPLVRRQIESREKKKRIEMKGSNIYEAILPSRSSNINVFSLKRKIDRNLISTGFIKFNTAEDIERQRVNWNHLETDIL